MGPRMRDEGECDLHEIKSELASLVQRRLRARLFEQTNLNTDTHHGPPHSPMAFVRVMERSIATSSPRLNAKRTNTRSSSKLERMPSAEPSAGTPARARPRSAPVRVNFRPNANAESPGVKRVPSTDAVHSSKTFQASIGRVSKALDVYKLLAGSQGKARDSEELDEILAQLQSRARDNQLQGLKKLEARTFTRAFVRKLARQGHVQALCNLISVYLRQLQSGRFGDEDTDPGYRAMYIMFKVGAVDEAFPLVASSIVELAMPYHLQAKYERQRSASHSNDSREVADDAQKDFPPLSQILAADENPLKIRDASFTWDPLSLKLEGLPEGNSQAVNAVAVGSMLWVYKMARVKTNRKAFQTFVQLMPTGRLFIGGKEQQVSVLSVVQGSTPELDEAFDLCSERRACVFRVNAKTLDCALTSTASVSLAFAANTIRERDLWIHGISVVAVRCSAEMPMSQGLVPKVTASCSSTLQGDIQKRPSYHGECDAFGMPSGCGVAFSEDGSKHVGEWANGLLNGKAALIMTSGEKYMGEWKDGLADGLGVHFAVGGMSMRYEGEWLNDARHGYGVESNADGVVFCGTYVDGRRHGEGLHVDGSTGC
jgi:hypothetical protein